MYVYMRCIYYSLFHIENETFITSTISTTYFIYIYIYIYIYICIHILYTHCVPRESYFPIIARNAIGGDVRKIEQLSKFHLE